MGAELWCLFAQSQCWRVVLGSTYTNVIMETIGRTMSVVATLRALWYFDHGSQITAPFARLGRTSLPMTGPNKSAERANPLKTCTLHVCTSCRTRGAPRGPIEERPGFILYRQLREAVANNALAHQVVVKPAECLSLCPRPCGIALSSPDSWTYLFGDQQPDATATDIVECVSRYLANPDGFMARNERPTALRSSILGRIPPMQRGQKCT